MSFPESLFERLSEEGQAAAPVHLRLIRPVPPSIHSPTRQAYSRPYRASGYACLGFHKPISKPLDMGAVRTAPPVPDRQEGPGQRPPSCGCVFRLFACCLPVRGARRSVVCDLQRQSFHLIPNGLYEILTEHRGEPVTAIKELYQHEFDDEIDEYFEFLVAHELGFFCDDPEAFPDLDLAWETPERITNAILDIDAGSAHDYAEICRQLDDLGCKALQVRCYTSSGLVQIQPLLEAARHGRLRTLELFIPYGPGIGDDSLEALCRQHPRLDQIVVHAALENRQHDLATGARIVYRTDVLSSPACCGQVHPAYFSVQLSTFTEAQRHNTCLNRKISIDARGEIKNCPSMAKSFGNVKTVSLHEALAQRDFSALWAINKDQIEICKDCEFRYICTDCRAYISDARDPRSKPSKCTYDPYSATWREPAPATRNAAIAAEEIVSSDNCSSEDLGLRKGEAP